MKRIAALLVLLSGAAGAQPAIDTVPIGDGLKLAYYVSAPPGAPVGTILIGIHGYTRDANRTFDAAAEAAGKAGQTGTTLIVAPIFQVPEPEAADCRFRGVPAASPGDALWRCGHWSDGSVASNGAVTSFAAMDRLEAVLLDRYPGVRTITVAGFSAGGQYVQRYAGFAHPPAGVHARYVVSDPSGFVYFDPWRPEPGIDYCPDYNRWKFGIENLPATLGGTAEQARAAYVSADLAYLEGALDTGTGPGTASRLLESSCSARLQGPYRLERGQFYAAYDADRLAHGAHRLTVVPGCAHSVSCVFPSAAAREALFPAHADGK